MVQLRLALRPCRRSSASSSARAIGAAQGYWVAYFRIPSFIVTLAGMLIFRGLALAHAAAASRSGRSPSPSSCSAPGFIPDVLRGAGELQPDLAAARRGVGAGAGLCWRQVRARANAAAHGMDAEPMRCSSCSRTRSSPAPSLCFTYLLASLQGPAQRADRHGRADRCSTTSSPRARRSAGASMRSAATRRRRKLSGIKTERLTFFTFVNMGVLPALAGLIFAARLNTATPKAGLGFELDVIAACFIGGASASGGVGKVDRRGDRRLHHGRDEQRHVDHGRRHRLPAGHQGPGAAGRGVSSTSTTSGDEIVCAEEQVSARHSYSDALVDQTREKLRRDDELAPCGVESRSRLGRNGLLDRASLLLELDDFLVDRNQHVAISQKLRLVADGLAVSGDNDGIVAHGGDVGFRRLDHAAFDAAAGRIVDEGIDAVPEGVTGMENIGLREGDEDVTVGMGGSIIPQLERGAIERQRPVVGHHLGRNCGNRRWRKIEIPVIDPLRRHQVLARVFMREDCRAFAVEPFVSVGMIEVPMGIDQMLDRVGAEAVGGFQDARLRGGDAGIDKNLAVAARQHGDIAAGAFEDADIAAHLVDLDLRLRGIVPDQVDNGTGLGVCLRRAQPTAPGNKADSCSATEAKTTT